MTKSSIECWTSFIIIVLNTAGLRTNAFFCSLKVTLQLGYQKWFRAIIMSKDFILNRSALGFSKILIFPSAIVPPTNNHHVRFVFTLHGSSTTRREQSVHMCKPEWALANDIPSEKPAASGEKAASQHEWEGEVSQPLPSRHYDLHRERLVWICPFPTFHFLLSYYCYILQCFMNLQSFPKRLPCLLSC